MVSKALFRFLLLGSFLMLLLSACTSGTNSPPQATVSPTPRPSPTTPPPPPGTVLYQADWSHGLATLQATKGWSVVKGQLVINATTPSSITLPYIPKADNYAIEVSLRVLPLHQIGGSFSISADRQPTRDGYQAGISGIEGTAPRPNGAHAQSQVLLDPHGPSIGGSEVPQDFEPGQQTQTYRVEISGSEAKLFCNGTQVGYANTQNTPLLSNSPLKLNANQVLLQVSSLRIVSL